MGEGLLFVFVVLIIATTAYKIVELKHRSRNDKDDSESLRHMLAQEFADRDDRARALEERIRVLEKIITDNHKSYKLSEEIEDLKEQANG